MLTLYIHVARINIVYYQMATRYIRQDIMSNEVATLCIQLGRLDVDSDHVTAMSRSTADYDQTARACMFIYKDFLR
jgi:hypothetical protein